ncbi:NUDIX domain-containing protein [Halosegnis marinus]|uniref:NUDIX domain-containing protein n=1 Tax=Halosegnis marinus TaxID=3034023 RepID=A0ABD5ZKV7_9EURY|nr:NUDIX domain-containing protein [Halosegnis sp. DT85]
MPTDPIPLRQWRTVVANVPIVSVDLLVTTDDGLLLGKRTNEPARGYYFPPGGRVEKFETRTEAVHRIADEELGLDVEIIESLGSFEHIYDTADVSGVNGKHYLANGFVVAATGGRLQPDDQHENLRAFVDPPTPLHHYLRTYLDASEILPDWS